MMLREISPRKREILGRVVEEYVRSGQPVGSRTLVEQGGLDVSASTVRSELSELEVLGLLGHPHTSAGRVPTEEGYRVYAEGLVETLDSRPASLPLDLGAMRTELEAALRLTTETLSRATRLLALVSAPSPRAATIRHVEVLLLQPNLVMVVVITSAGGVTKRVLELDDPVDPGLAAWAHAYLNESLAGVRLGTALLRRRFEDPGLAQSERSFLDSVRPAFVDVLEEEQPQLFVGGAAGLLGEARADELEACQRLLDVLDHRTTALELLSGALDPQRTFVRVGPELDGSQLHEVSYVGATYGLASTSLGTVGLLGPSRMDYEKAIRAVRSAALELSRLVEDVYEGS